LQALNAIVTAKRTGVAILEKVAFVIVISKKQKGTAGWAAS
jgi:hypothetical protein